MSFILHVSIKPNKAGKVAGFVCEESELVSAVVVLAWEELSN